MTKVVLYRRKLGWKRRLFMGTRTFPTMREALGFCKYLHHIPGWFGVIR